jgi:glycosyltransferase involved in cell wall biosynthesis
MARTIDRACGPAVAVVIPTYDRPRWLGEAIESVLAQTYGNFELVVSDNASGPETAKLVARYDDPRLRYVRRDEHTDLNTHFTYWLDNVEAPYLFLLPDDDLMYPELLERAVAVLETERSAGAVHAQADMIDDDGSLVHAAHDMTGAGADVLERGAEFVRAAMRSAYRVHASTALFRTEAVRGLAYELAITPRRTSASGCASPPTGTSHSSGVRSPPTACTARRTPRSAPRCGRRATCRAGR